MPGATRDLPLLLIGQQVEARHAAGALKEGAEDGRERLDRLN
jgi:hypothetical protein